MSLGSSSNILDPSIVRVFNSLKPSSLLDVGCGQGKIGALCKPLLPDCSITGVQKVFSESDVESLSRLGYSRVIDIDILDYFKIGFDEFYDIAAICDVLEHFLFSDAISILKFLLYRCNWIVLVWPSKHPQSAVSHPFDRHRFSLEPRELFQHFDIIRYEQVGFAQINAIHTYHLAVIRGDMNLLNPPRF